MRNENIIITRGQVGQWSSFVGGTALLIGIIGWVWQGGTTPVIIAALVIGALGIALWALVTPDEFRGFISGRQVRYGTTAVFGTLMLIGIVALVYVVLARAVLTLDMTGDGRFTLSAETHQVLQRIQRPIQLTGFYSSRGLALREVDDQFFRQYEVESGGMVTRKYINPEEDPVLVDRYGVNSDGQVFISYLNADGTIDEQTLARVPRSGRQERDVTEAISRLLISGTITVYFEQGRGELDPTDTTQQGLSGINLGVQESGLITQPLNLVEIAAAGGDIPQDAGAVIFARPTSDLTPAEVAVIDRYLQRGGTLFIMTDPLFNEDRFLKADGPFNQFLWTNYGLRALDAVVVDAGSSFQTPLDVLSAAIFPENSIVARMNSENAPAYFRLARALEVSETPPANVPNGQLILSSEQSYGETDLATLSQTSTYQYDEGADIPGPLTSAVFAYHQQTGAKILMVGDADFVTNGLIGSGGNALLFTDGLSWLTGLSEQVEFAPQAFGSSVPLIFVSGQMLDVIAFVTVILLPGLLLVIGIVVWLRRMRA
ncbi:MAG: GldG family protein [Anaerolineae bacterium]|nr:GldG family protein [Anaerolineae bacterium]